MKRLLLCALAGCAQPAPAIELVVEGPVDDPSATASDLDDLAIAVAHAGEPTDLVVQRLEIGRAADLGGIAFADDLVVHLTGRIGGGEVAYGRTCSFAFDDSDGANPSPHLFFARNVRFADLGVELVPRRAGTALTDRDGNGIVVGGIDGAGQPVTTIERFDPRTGTTSSSAQLATRSDGLAVPFGLGLSARIAVLGGHSEPQTVELVDTSTSKVTIERIDDARGDTARSGASVTTLGDGSLVMIGGTIGGIPSGAIAQIGDVSGAIEIAAIRTTLAHPRTGHTATRLGTAVGAPVLIAGGVDGAGAPIATAELFHPLSEDLADPATFSPAMHVPRTRHQAQVMPDGSVLFVGGIDAAGAPVRTLERFTLDEGFVVVGELPISAGVVDFSATALPDGRVLLVGGSIPPATTAVDTAFIVRLDVIDGSVDVVSTDRLAIPRSGHQATALCDGTILVVGGDPAATRVERYDPPAFGRR